MNILFSTVRKEEKDFFISKLKNRFKRVEFISDYLPDRSERSFFYKIIKNFRKKIYTNNFIENLYDKECKKFYRKKLNNFDCSFDYFFVISREFSKNFIRELKDRMPNIKTILFIWDKLDYSPYKNNYDAFDYIFSFDKKDCEKYGFKFRASYFIDSFREDLIEYTKRKYDLYYIGQLREKKRLIYLEKIYKNLKNKNLNLFIKIYNDLKDKSIIITKKLELNKKISYIENMNKIKNSRVIIDISYKEQKGLTLRCFEALATQTKIITDNVDIVNYDFYNSNNIFILKSIEDIKNIPFHFFKEKYHKIDEDIINKYSVDGFLEEIFNYVQAH
ncbi:MAG: hypothetical protein Q4A58_06745 [Fusobacterium sp.]|uniref:hypothetical protein n=1 Tax=Fusobacterium sp. TaxID=68766 RepID=UPI0026DB584A|nr:hypothetical protein [Fusobacterium sp.]MDO4690973.1 hypothetical protein [Fusobacterium sp.]